MSVRKLDLFIGGEWVPASTDEVIDLLNPATGELLAHVPVASPAISMPQPRQRRKAFVSGVGRARRSAVQSSCARRA